MEPHHPLDYPSVFNGTGRRMLERRIAVWSYLRNDYQVYDVDRQDWPVIRLTPTNTSRTSPFYFAEGDGDNSSRTVTIYRPRARIHSHADMAIWHTGGWLCRMGNHNRLVPVLPILAVSDPAKLPWVGNVGLHTEFESFACWFPYQTLHHYRPIIHNRILSQSQWDDEDNSPTGAKPDPVPQFVAEALLKMALAAEEQCPIVMEPLVAGDTSATSCFHLFSRAALDEWLLKNNTCPVCKKECSVTHC